MEALLAGGDDTIIIVAVALLMGLLMLIIGMLATGDGGKDKKRRVRRVKNASNPLRSAESEAINIRRDKAFSTNKAMDVLIRRLLPQPENMRAKLARTGFDISLGKYLIANVVVAVVFGGLFLMMSTVLPAAAAVLLGLLLGAAVPYLTVKFLIGRRRNKFIHNFPEAIDLMVRGLKSGLPVTETIKVVGEESQDPISTEFSSITDSVRFGKKLDEALWEVSERLDMQEFNFFTVTLSIQSETGGNLAETLENLSDVLRGRRQMKLKIKALSAEPKSSAYIIGSLPFIMLGLIFALNPDYIMQLFTDPRGNIALAVAGLWFLIGIAAMWKMVRFEI